MRWGPCGLAGAALDAEVAANVAARTLYRVTGKGHSFSSGHQNPRHRLQRLALLLRGKLQSIAFCDDWNLAHAPGIVNQRA